MEQIHDIDKIMTLLKRLEYPDYFRIAKEVITHLKENPTIQLEDVTARLELNEPWEYIRGYTLFMERKFIVTSNVLIPRIETEQLVNLAIEKISDIDVKTRNKGLNIIDIGTGSGCILLSVFEHFRSKEGFIENMNFIGTDISTDALEVAKINMSAFLPEENHSVQFVHTSLLECIERHLDVTLPTVILSNPPYIESDEYRNLDSSVRDWEPQIALLDTGKNGNSIAKELIGDAASIFSDLQYVLIELSPTNVEDAKEYASRFGDVQVIDDVFGRKRFLQVEDFK